MTGLSILTGWTGAILIKYSELYFCRVTCQQFEMIGQRLSLQKKWWGLGFFKNGKWWGRYVFQRKMTGLTLFWGLKFSNLPPCRAINFGCSFTLWAAASDLLSEIDSEKESSLLINCFAWSTWFWGVGCRVFDFLHLQHYCWEFSSKISSYTMNNGGKFCNLS